MVLVVVLVVLEVVLVVLGGGSGGPGGGSGGPGGDSGGPEGIIRFALGALGAPYKDLIKSSVGRSDGRSIH